MSKTFIKTQTGAVSSPAQVPLGTAQETKNSTGEGWTLRVWEYKHPTSGSGIWGSRVNRTYLEKNRGRKPAIAFCRAGVGGQGGGWTRSISHH